MMKQIQSGGEESEDADSVDTTGGLNVRSGEA
jgi:hypothetical protein